MVWVLPPIKNTLLRKRKQPKRTYTTKEDKTRNKINREYNWIAMQYMGKDKMTPNDRINRLKYQIKMLKELHKDPKLSKKVINKELETKQKKLKMEIHYGIVQPTTSKQIKKKIKKKELFIKTKKGYTIKLKEKGKWLSYEELSEQLKEVVEKDESVKPMHKDIRRYWTWKEIKEKLEQGKEAESKQRRADIKSGKIKHLDDELQIRIKELKKSIKKDVKFLEFFKKERKTGVSDKELNRLKKNTKKRLNDNQIELKEKEQRLSDLYEKEDRIKHLEAKLWNIDSEEYLGWDDKSKVKRKSKSDRILKIKDEIRYLKKKPN